jgi:hypothetical protein
VVSFSTVSLYLVVSVSQALFEEGSDIVSDALKFLITICLRRLETTGHMAANEGHGNGI